MPPYESVVANAERYRGQIFRISGRVTGVNDTIPQIKKTKKNPKGGDYDPIEVFVFWDESERVGEVAEIHIERKYYDTTVRERRHFVGMCTLIGLDDRDHPLLVCTDYSSS